MNDSCRLVVKSLVVQLLNFVPTDALQMGASQFEQSAGALKRKYWWKNLKVSAACAHWLASLAFAGLPCRVDSLVTRS